MFYKKRFDWFTWINAGVGLGMLVWQQVNGELPFGFRSKPAAAGNFTGSSDNGTGTSPQLGQ